MSLENFFLVENILFDSSLINSKPQNMRYESNWCSLWCSVTFSSFKKKYCALICFGPFNSPKIIKHFFIAQKKVASSIQECRNVKYDFIVINFYPSSIDFQSNFVHIFYELIEFQTNWTFTIQFFSTHDINSDNNSNFIQKPSFLLHLNAENDCKLHCFACWAFN